MKKQIGKNTLGGGKKMEVSLRHYNRSNHNLSYVWRNPQGVGTLVPFMVNVANRGDTFDIDLTHHILTHPTLAPLFGSFKFQADIFRVPIRLYHSALHNNALNIGLNMSKILLPTYSMRIGKTEGENYGDMYSQSSIQAYLGVRGEPFAQAEETVPELKKNAIPLIAYWDIFKNYYANHIEDEAYVIGGDMRFFDSLHILDINDNLVQSVQLPTSDELRLDFRSWVSGIVGVTGTLFLQDETMAFTRDEVLRIRYSQIVEVWTGDQLHYTSLGHVFQTLPTAPPWPKGSATLPVFFDTSVEYGTILGMNGWILKGRVPSVGTNRLTPSFEGVTKHFPARGGRGSLTPFPLVEIDDLRESILQKSKYERFDVRPETNLLAQITLGGLEKDGNYIPNAYGNSNGLLVKTYQSDLFNNWVKTDWIDGEGGINAITAVDTSGGSFTLDTLNLSEKVFDLLNRIAVSGGSYKNWLETVWTAKDISGVIERPVYEGGMSCEVVFEEMTATASTDFASTGDIVGKGRTQDKKGGSIVIRVDEPSYIIGICSLTPRIDYSQGNAWHTRLDNMDDLHKPALDGIGFQDLITEQMHHLEAHWVDGEEKLFSAGKQTAWINYQTDINRCYGNFAEPNNEMFMTLNRKYSTVNGRIMDLTTYIDPGKFNDIFAHADINAQNFWVQLSVDIKARRLMSAKQIPNL